MHRDAGTHTGYCVEVKREERESEPSAFIQNVVKAALFQNLPLNKSFSRIFLFHYYYKHFFILLFHLYIYIYIYYLE